MDREYLYRSKTTVTYLEKNKVKKPWNYGARKRELKFTLIGSLYSIRVGLISLTKRNWRVHRLRRGTRTLFLNPYRTLTKTCNDALIKGDRT